MFFFFICLAWLCRQSNRVNVQFTGRSLDKFRARDVYKLVECNRLGVCIEKETAEVVGSTSVELEADTDGEEDDTDSEEVELAVIFAGVIRITGVLLMGCQCWLLLLLAFELVCWLLCGLVSGWMWLQ